MGIRECHWSKSNKIVYSKARSWLLRSLQPGSLATCHSNWADTEPCSAAGIFVQLTFSELVVMQHVCSLGTHCSYEANTVTKNPTYFRIFLIVNTRQCHQKASGWAEELNHSWVENSLLSHVALPEGEMSLPSLNPQWLFSCLTPANLLIASFTHFFWSYM